MEGESFDLTIEDVLGLHRGWITKLFVDDLKTEVEIVELLYERRLLITLPQIRRCLRNWNLMPAQHSPSPQKLEVRSEVRHASTQKSPDLRIETTSVSDGWELVSPKSLSRSQLLASSNTPSLPDSPTYTPSPDFDGSENIDRYKKSPLPSLPATSKHKRKPSTFLEPPKKDKLKLTCHHGDEFHAVEMTLGTFGQGPSPIETYANDDQSHERIAVGLERDPHQTLEQLPTTSFRKSGQWSGLGSGSGSRTIKSIVKRDPRKRKDR